MCVYTITAYLLPTIVREIVSCLHSIKLSLFSPLPAIGAGVMLVSYLQVAFWSLPAKRQARRIRMLFFKACLRQNIGWFDTNPAGELSTRLAE